MFPAKSPEPHKPGRSHTTGRHGSMQTKPRARRPKKRTVTDTRSEARLADLRDLFENIQRRNRKVAAAVVTIAEHAANAPGDGLARAIGLVVAFVAREAR